LGTGELGQDSRDRTAKTGQLGKDIPDKTVSTEQLGKDSLTGQPIHDRGGLLDISLRQRVREYAH
jgi:hypothetical protein